MKSRLLAVFAAFAAAGAVAVAQQVATVYSDPPSLTSGAQDPTTAMLTVTATADIKGKGISGTAELYRARTRHGPRDDGRNHGQRERAHAGTAWRAPARGRQMRRRTSPLPAATSIRVPRATPIPTPITRSTWATFRTSTSAPERDRHDEDHDLARDASGRTAVGVRRRRHRDHHSRQPGPGHHRRSRSRASAADRASRAAS